MLLSRNTVRGSVTAGVIVGFMAASLPGPASAQGLQTVPSPRATPQTGTEHTTLARGDGGLAVDSLAVPGPEAASRSAGTAAALARTRVRPFQLAGVTWRAGSTPAATVVQLRVRSGGSWTGWTDLAPEDDEGPTVAQEPGARAGTGPVWVGDANGVAVRVTSASGLAPADLQVVTVDPGDDPGRRHGSRTGSDAVATARPASGAALSRTPSFPHKPRVISRKRWGADPRLTEHCSAPRYGRTARMVFVHHTVNSNKYRPREAPGIVRGIYAYHTQGQNWCDIGYNALIDRFGNVYEGRRGGLSKPVRGAHAGDYNTGTVGVSMIGNFDVARTSKRMRHALVRFVGGRFGTSYQPVRGGVSVAGARFSRIAGHRDAMSTACPGRYLYAQLPRIRKRAASYLSRYSSRLERKADRLGKRRTGAVWKGERPVRGGYRTVFHQGVMFGKRGVGAHFLRGRTLSRYQHTGGPKGALGWPTSNVKPSSVRRVRVLVTQRGRIYLPRGKPARVLHGPVYRRYRATGLATGRLGLPRTSVRRTTSGARARFRHGVVSWNRQTGKTTVRFR